MSEPQGLLAETSARLKVVEEALQRCEMLAVASHFAGAIMHEVNNPLEALTNLVYLTKQTPNDAEQVLLNMEIADSQLVRLGEITRKTLSFYKAQPEARDLDLIDLAESALTIHAHRIGSQDVELRKCVQNPAVARIFAGEILQVLSNLILNSLDALPQSGAILCLRVRTCCEMVRITISDNGMGVDPAIYKNLFQANCSSKSKGTGFGLWLCRNIIEKHNGTISCRTSRQPTRRGTTFRVSLPMTKLFEKNQSDYMKTAANLIQMSAAAALRFDANGV